MTIPDTLLEIRTYAGGGFLPLINHGTWRVAVLRYLDRLLPPNLDTMQRHGETDEVFVLFAGRSILFIGEGNERVSEIHAQDMEPLTLYNVKKGCWHTHTLSPDATILIVENQDTSERNSARAALDSAQQEKIMRLTAHLWQT